MKISVIVPVYNVEKYLDNCLNSLANQTLKDIEIIIVNDGSTDNSQKIIDKYVKKFSNFKSFVKENGGVSKARNYGKEKATGDYIAFLDSDDFIEPNMYELLYNKAKQGDFDIVFCDTLAVFDDKKQYISCNVKSDNVSNKQLMIDAYAVIWNKIYKRELLKDINFKEGINYCEDVEFLYLIYSRTKKIGVINKPLHNYLQRPGSLTYVFDEKLYHVIEVMDDILNFYKKNKIYNEYKEELEYTYVRYLYATFIKRIIMTRDKKEFNKALDLVINKVNKNFPNYKKNKYIKAINLKSIYLKYFNKFVANIIFKIKR